MRLIYHDIGAGKAASPFDSAIQEVAYRAPLLRLASPYIGLGFLLRTLDHAVDWRLLSDVEAWLHSGNHRHRAKCWEFISDNLDHIRHVPDLHAKVVIGNNKLFLGSANFTEMGVLGRTEMSVLIEEASTVQEAVGWFDALWEVASPPILEEGDALVSALETAAWTRPRIEAHLTATAPQVSAVLAESPRPEGFDLAGVMARAGLQESVKLANLEEAYRELSDDWFTQGRPFSFIQLSKQLKSVSLAENKDIWRLVTRETVNHWLGGLVPDGYDRYHYQGGLFYSIKAAESNHAESPAPEQILRFLLTSIPPLPASKPFPMENAWEAAGLRSTSMMPVLELMLDAGLLIEHDLPGEIERYSIDPEFEWPPRWNKFKEARRLFVSGLRTEAARSEVSQPQKDTHRYEGERTVIWNHLDAESRASPRKKTPGLLAGGPATLASQEQARELKRAAKREGRSVEEIIRDHDRVLAGLIQLTMERRNDPVLISRSALNQELIRHRIIDSLRFAFTHPDLMLKDTKSGLVFNPKWNGSHHLRQFPAALDSWSRAVQPVRA